MQKTIHPTYYPKAKATCVCGAVYDVGSTLESFEVEICSACHPFYSGGEKIIDTAGRVERFKKLLAAAKTASSKKKSAKMTAKKGK